jgi:copper chaperone CopZ
MKTKKIYKIDGMHCPSCAMLIEGELEDRGVAGQCSYAKQIVEVEQDTEKNLDTVVEEAVKAAGYSLKK